ncbi:hypothetical protein, partial [Halobacillus sp. BBL2006]|uniref:hypothetical protein n=1 Tax=Halobacillus sp. BBL2006 TaxID=1543706 RepID=UPI0005545E16
KKQRKWIVVAAVFLAFAIGAYVATAGQGDKLSYSEQSQLKRKAKAVDMDKLPVGWREVENEEEIKKFYEGKIRSLKLAREKGLTTTPEISTPVQQRDGRLQINEVWHNGHTITILYSIDLSTLVKEQKKAPTRPPFVESLRLGKANNQNKMTIDSYGRPIQFTEGVVYKNRLYTYTQTPSFTEEGMRRNDRLELEPFHKKLETAFEFRINGRNFQTEAVPVQYNYNPEEQKLGHYTFSDTYQKNGLTIQPLELTTGLDKSTIKLRVEDANDRFNQMIEASLMIEDGKRVSLPLPLRKVQGEEDVYTSEFFSNILNEKEPEAITFTIERVHLSGDTSYSFDLDVSKDDLTRSAIKRINEKVAEAFETDVTLVQKDSRGRNNGLNVQLKYEPHDFEQEQMLVASSPFFYSEAPNNRPKNVHIESDNGESDEVTMMGGGDFAYFNVRNNLIKDADKLSITVKDVALASRIDQSFEGRK